MKLTTKDLSILEQVKKSLETDYIHYHPQSQLAKRYHINESKLRSGFVQVYHKPIYEYLVQVRIEKAKWLLENTEDPIKTIAANVGYDIRNFQKQFKKLTAMVPHVWRNLYTHNRNQNVTV